MPELDTINLCKNFVKKIEGLDNCKKLHSLLLGYNHLASADDVRHARVCPELMTLDVQHNRIDDVRILEVLAAMPDLRVVYLMGNPVVKSIRYYRKTVIAACPKLRYLDDRPVFDDERRRVKRWKAVYDETGDYDKALEAEREEIRTMREEKKAADDRNFRAFEEMMREGLEIRRKREEAGVSGETRSAVTALCDDSVVRTAEHPELKEIREARLAKLLDEGGLDGAISTFAEGGPNAVEASGSGSRGNSSAGPTDGDAETKVGDMGASTGCFFAASDRDSGRSSPLPPPPPGHGSDGTKCALLNELMRGDIWGDDEITIEDEGTRAYDELDAPSRSLMHIDMPVPPPSALIETDFDELD